MSTGTKKLENPLQKERRFKARKQVFKSTYKKGVFYNQYAHKNLVDYLNQPNVFVRVINAGSLDDDTTFVTITIEGFKPGVDGI